ncbi:hypothetical protein IMCC26256_11287 [Actinobacteria bacterium IMCC26256]|nr:hypothetical protein IMCC26256_11287 [Actinobacteria bacterium IMCC26256]
MRILALAVFERIVYQCTCPDTSSPERPTLEVDALLRDGDADGPLLLPMADLKRMLGFSIAEHHILSFRESGRSEFRDGVEYLSFPVWKNLSQD